MVLIVENHSVSGQIESARLNSFKFRAILTTEFHGYVITEQHDSNK
jgi:hypothetical protein